MWFWQISELAIYRVCHAEVTQQLDADLLKFELGANAVRTLQGPQSQYFMDRCDEIGLLVIPEIPGWQFVGILSGKRLQ